MSCTNIFEKHFPVYWSHTEIYLYISQRDFSQFFKKNIYYSLLTIISLIPKYDLTWTISFLSIDHVFTCVWKKNGVILSTEVNPNKVWRAPCYRYDHIFLGGEIEWDSPHCHLGWEQQKLPHSCERKNQTQTLLIHKGRCLSIEKSFVLFWQLKITWK